MKYICVNGKFLRADQPVWMADNKSYRYGDGFFETMKLYKGEILLQEKHLERFFATANTLGYIIPSLFDSSELIKQVKLLCEKNNCSGLARVRLSAFRGNGGIYDGDHKLNYLIECWELAETVNQLNENGLHIGIYNDARKSCDKFSNLKSANFLPYVMAAQHAKKKKWNDCIVLNTAERIADATIANVFVVKDERIMTPPLTEGCVAGVMRKWLITSLLNENIGVEESPLTVHDLQMADEIFLTNAISGIKWVGQLDDKTFTNTKAREIYNRFIKPMYQ